MTDRLLMYSYCFAGGSLLVLVLLGLAVSVGMPGMNRQNRHFFISSFLILLLSIAVYLIDLFACSDPNLAQTERIVAFFETLLPSLLLPLQLAYILYLSGDSWRKSVLFHAVLAFWSALLILLCITQFTESIYYITPDNQFVRGPWYPVLILPMTAMIVICLAGVILKRQKLTKKCYIAFLLYLLPSLVAMIVQMFMTAFLLIVFAVSISALSMLWIILADYVTQYLHQQREILDQRTKIAVLQMRPHFIYNTMMSIYYLCEQNPQKAQQVTLDFTTYLRKNFHAIASENPIPFSEELEHTRAYLAVEQAKYDDILLVEYDTPHISFCVPPLTLQPIVENAIKHGMDPDADEPLHISVRTQKTDLGNEIIVEDNGSGFSHRDNKDPHIALDNIRQRLSLMCDGSLEIDTRETGGIRVIIRIP